MRSPSPRPADRLEHDVLVYGGLEEYLAATVPHLREGVEAGEVPLVVVPEPRLSALRDALGADGREATFVDADEFYAHPVRALRDYDRILRLHAPRRLRVVGERNWSDDPLETVEWARYESLVNTLFAASGARVICAYDRDAVRPQVLEHALRTHRRLIDGRSERHNDAYPESDYLEPAGFGADGAWSPPPPDAAHLPFGAMEDLQRVRRFVAARASGHGLDEKQIAALETAVTEAATNALKHGAAPRWVRVWRRPGEFVCEVSDHGRWRPGALAGFTPPVSALERGFGLWTVRLLVDVVRLHAGEDGTSVRLLMRR
ncbi:sensor histidine kinase [uncultured Thermomonospora sp.]|uniref:sensor histidine kinase n=1 Tax=uncultured Thermomonospora sp. TaxID=671175 RepID=UPI00259B8E01|nr:sensor histidine kinase [uncultured Thermomonospora sp.]